MQIVISKEPTVYDNTRKLIVVYKEEKLFIYTLSVFTSKLRVFERITRKIISNLFEKLTQLSVSFQLPEVTIEQDTEIDSWKYVVVKIKLDVQSEMFDKICEILISHAYKDVTPEDAVKVLLVFEHV